MIRKTIPVFLSLFFCACSSMMYPDKFSYNPQIGAISQGSGLSAGVRFGTDFLETSLAVSYRVYQQYEVFIGLHPPREWIFLKSYDPFDIYQFAGIREDQQGFFLYGTARYRNYPQEGFYGLGSFTSHELRTDYRMEEASAHAVGGYQFGRNQRIDFRAGFLHPQIGPGTDHDYPDTGIVFEELNTPGLIDQPDFFRISSAVLVDYRDQGQNPHRGGVAAFSYSRYDDLNHGIFSWNRFSWDARGYLPLSSVKHVAAARLLTSFSQAGEKDRVPFYYQQTLGGSHTLRGFPNFRFRDNHLFHFTLEYRWEIHPMIEAAGFLDAGKVFHDAEDFGFRDLQKSYGAGVRFKLKESGVLVRFEIARSSEDTRFLLQFGPSF